ncbi:MAG: glycosyltransferase [Planctomycetota bacterium]|nr:glycosyltransferase [Planctomycetota bacterium]
MPSSDVLLLRAKSRLTLHQFNWKTRTILQVAQKQHSSAEASLMKPAISHPTARPRVVRLIARLNVGGPAQHVAWLNAGLRDEFESTLIAGNIAPGEVEMTDFARAMGVEPIIVAGLSREISIRDLPATWQVYRLLLKLRPDIVHTHTAKAGTIGRVAAMLYRWLTPGTLIGRPRPCQVVHTYHGHVFHSYFGRVKTRLILLIEQVLAKVTDRIVVISARQLEEIQNLLGRGGNGRFCVIPLGLDLDRFNGWQTRRQVLRSEVGALTDDVLIGIVGRLVDIKNHELFLNSVATFISDYASRLNQRVRFLIIGNGPLQDRLMEQSRDLNLNDHVTFMGLRMDPEIFYPGLDIVMLTSKNEGTPLSLIEAMANGRAVLSTAVGGVVDVLGSENRGMENGVSGEKGVCLRLHGISTAETANSLASAVFQLASDRQLRTDLGERGEAFVRRAHSKDRLINNVADLYRSLLSLKRDSSP